MQDALDIAGIGIGPSNLSVAALLHGIDGVRARFFERRDHFAWHPGLMFPGARMQTSFLKDLVTAVAPTSPHSFVNYLVSHGRFYPFLARERACVPRREFADYLGWVADRLPDLRFGVDIREVRFAERAFELLDADGRRYRAEHLCVGTGRAPRVPECARAFVGDRCFHAIDILERELSVAGRSVAVIGGGQTGAEVVLELLHGRWGTPSRLHWASRRLNFEPLDESPFSNHLFTPSYVRLFHGLQGSERRELLEWQRLAGDGISHGTLEELHDVIYDRVASGRAHTVDLLPGRELVQMRGPGELTLRNRIADTCERIQADVIVLCTGFDDRPPPCLEGLATRLRTRDGQLEVDSTFAVQWDGPAEHRVYVVNAGRHAFGIAESQLSLMAWRSAVIVNDLIGRPRFPTDGVDLIRWSADHTRPARRAAISGGGERE